jgi:flagellar hook-length control protein FliK
MARRVHRFPRITVSTEANLTSHLSISYSAAPTASGTPATASGATAPGNAAGASGESMAGFLAALVDQLLAGAAATDATAVASATPETATPSTPAPLGAAIDPSALSVVQSTVPRGSILLKQLTQGLQALQDQLDKGETPDPDLLKRLGDLADAIAGLVNVPAPGATPTVDPELVLDPLASTGQASGKSKTDKLAGLADTKASADRPPTIPDSVAQLLASLGLPLPAAPSAADPATAESQTGVAAATASQPLPAIAQLADKLAALTQTIAASSPEVAQKLEALAKKLDAAETAPQALAQLTVPSDTDATELDRVVQALIAAKPTSPAPATPALAAKTELPTPAPIVRDAPQADATTQALAAPSSVDPAATVSAKPGTRSADVVPTGDTPDPEAKVIAAATTKSDPKPEATDAAGQQNGIPATSPAVAASVARAIPAAYQAASSPINMGQVAFEMVRQVHQGISRFSFRLDPPELGRVDVKMHVDASGAVNARLTVERSETLDMFQRDRGALEKALSQAGLDSGKTNLEFSLKQNQQNPFAGLTGGDQRPNGGSNAGPQFPLAGSAQDGDDAVPSIPSITLYRGIASAGGVNLFV